MVLIKPYCAPASLHLQHITPLRAFDSYLTMFAFEAGVIYPLRDWFNSFVPE